MLIATIPEAGTIIIRTCQESSGTGCVDDVPYRSVMACSKIFQFNYWRQSENILDNWIILKRSFTINNCLIHEKL